MIHIRGGTRTSSETPNKFGSKNFDDATQVHGHECKLCKRRAEGAVSSTPAEHV